MNRPNIIYLHSHDTGRYVQPYGYAVSTPNIQKLAEEGVLFRQCFCAGPTCSPSRAALVTGQSPHSCGMIGLAHRGFSLNDYSRHIIHTLRKVGYRSVLAGVQHIARDPNLIGYDQILTRDSNKAAELASDFLRNSPSEPFFMSIGFGVTHREFHDPGPDEDPRYTMPPAPLPDTPETRRDMAAFKASARILDGLIGEVIDAVDRNGLRDNTLVICTTDHGIAFPDMKCNLTDHGIGVMLIMRGPNGFSDGKVCDAMISQIDLFPTICDLLEIDKPVWLEGKSMIPLINGKKDEINEEIFSEVTYHAAYEPKRAVRTRRWKYIKRFDGRKTGVMPNCDDSPSKKLWLDHGWRERGVAEEQLYDLMFDPNERCNLVGMPGYSSILEEMRSRLNNWMERTKDPLLAGFVPAPSGARMNDPDGLSPREKPFEV